MAYSDIALLSSDNDFINRTIACAATEDIQSPDVWATEHRWQLAATPTFGEKYGYAVANGVARPGNDPSVISDPEILSAVQAMMGTEPA